MHKRSRYFSLLSFRPGRKERHCANLSAPAYFIAVVLYGVAMAPGGISAKAQGAEATPSDAHPPVLKRQGLTCKEWAGDSKEKIDLTWTPETYLFRGLASPIRSQFLCLRWQNPTTVCVAASNGRRDCRPRTIAELAGWIDHWHGDVHCEEWDDSKRPDKCMLWNDGYEDHKTPIYDPSKAVPNTPVLIVGCPPIVQCLMYSK